MAGAVYALKALLEKIVTTLRDLIQKCTLDADAYQSATTKLAEQNYGYNAKFPPLILSNFSWSSLRLGAPETLAEALLWKRGRWNIYKTFVNYYSNPSILSKSIDTVFFAFAKHLQDSKLQYAIDIHSARSWRLNRN
jgi:hypothetical protein